MFQPAKRTNGNGVDRAGRKFQILTMLWEQRYGASITKKGGAWMTPYQVAKLIDMSPSNHLRGILEELYQEGVVLCQHQPHRSNQYKSVWAIADNARWTEPYKSWFDGYFERVRQEVGVQRDDEIQLGLGI